MNSNYEHCLKLTLVYEGGWSNHPADPGGATMKGVTQRVYDDYRRRQGLPSQSVRSLSDTELRAIYRRGYWDAVSGDTLPAGLDCSVFDLAVNSGPGRAMSFLRATSGDTITRIKGISARRRGFLQALKTFRVFGRGWMARCAAIEAASLRMAAGSRAPALLLAEASASQKQRAQAGSAVVGAGGAGAVPAGVAAATDHVWTWGEILATGGLALVLFAALAVLIHTTIAHNERARAMMEA